MSIILPPPPPQEDEFLLEEDSKEFGLTKGDYEFLLGDIEQAIEDANRKYGYGDAGYIDNDGNFYPFPDNDKPRRIKVKPVIATAVAVKKSKIQKQKEEAACLEFLRSKMRAADPILKESFKNKIEGVEF
jgi:hypothetical protein